MFYLNLQALISEPQNMGALAAHEFAHLILYYRDAMLDPAPPGSAESTWLSEGFTTYAEHLAGYDARVNGQLQAFTAEPGLGLTRFHGWRANYGASYAFVRYLAERQGPEFIRALVEQSLDGIAGINATLNTFGGFGETFDTLYDDWILANFLDGRPPPSRALCLRRSHRVGGDRGHVRRLSARWEAARSPISGPYTSTSRLPSVRLSSRRSSTAPIKLHSRPP